MTVFLEDSDGGIQDTPSEGQIAATLERIGSSLDHCILHLPGGAFVQTAGDASGLLLQYGDASGLYESDRSDFDAATITRVFAEAASGADRWKSEFSFRMIGETADGAGSATVEGSRAGGAFDGAASGGSLKDQLLGQVKREFTREASRGVGNLIRRGIRSITGRR